MDSIMLVKGADGLVAADDEAQAELDSLGAGEIVAAKIRRNRNYKFHKKWFALAQVAFDVWSETCPPLEYKGTPVQPNFDRFRKDLIILAGFYTPVYAADGTMRLQAKSISFKKMGQGEFEKVFSATIDAVMHKVLRNAAPWSEEDLRRVVDQIAGFA